MSEPEKVLIKAIISFNKKANELIKILADRYDLDLTSENPFGKLLSRRNNLWKGELPDNWTYQFHGSSCKFENIVTKQHLDISIIHGTNYKAINNFFLQKYIETTEELKYIPDIINSPEIFHKALAQLEKDNVIINIGEYPFNFRTLNYEAPYPQLLADTTQKND